MSLKIENQEHFDNVLAFAEKAGLRKQLDEKLEYLATYAEHGGPIKTRCLLHADWAPYSFAFSMQVLGEKDDDYRHWFSGGLIFHGSHDNGGDGSFPTLSVSLCPCVGWQVHT